MTLYHKINLIDYKSIFDWSILSQYVQSIQGTKFTYKELKHFLRRSKEEVEIKDDILYSRVTIKINNGGVYLRDKKCGKDIGTKNQYLIRKGQLLLSKIDARNGAFGIVPGELDGAIITGNFWVFDIDQSIILPNLLTLILSSKRFQDIWNSCSNGTTNRHYLQEKAFLNAKIPVPSIEEQKKILYGYQYKLSKSLSFDTEEIDKINKYLFSALKIEFSQTTKNSLLSFIDFSEISRWDTTYLKSLTNILSNAPLRKIGKFIKYWQCNGNGGIAINTNSIEFCDDTFHYIGMENVEKNSGKLCALPCVKGRDIKSTTLMVPKGFIIYNKLRPYLNKFWKNDTDFADIICSSEFFVFDTNEQINKEFFLLILSSNIVQEQLNRNYSGTRMPRITKEVFLDVKIPLPPIEDQLKIVNDLKHIKEIAQTNRKSAELLLRQSKQDFENAIFG